MGFPFVPVLIGTASAAAGAAAGAAVTYFVITRNSSSQNQLTAAAQDEGDSVHAEAGELKKIVSDTGDDAGKTVKDAAPKGKGRKKKGD